MTTPIWADDRDLRALAAIVSQDRPDLPDAEGLLPPSLLGDLIGQIRCDAISLERYDTDRQVHRWLQGCDADAQPETAGEEDRASPADPQRVFWIHYWDCLVCSQPARTGDLRPVVRTSDVYSTGQWHATGMYCEYIRPQGIEHHLMVSMPELPGAIAGPERYLRLVLHRGPGPDFSERDRALLVLLRPHLHQACMDIARQRDPLPRLTPRQNELLRLLAAGRTNAQIARRLGISEGTVRTHLENIYERLGVSSRTAAVTRAFPSQAA